MKSRKSCGCADLKDLRTSEGDTFSSRGTVEYRRIKAIALWRTTFAVLALSSFGLIELNGSICMGVVGVVVDGVVDPVDASRLLRVVERCRRARLGPSSWNRNVRRYPGQARPYF